MLRMRIDGVTATAIEKEVLTAGRVGLKCAFEFGGGDWGDLFKTAVFQGIETVDVALASNECTVPWEAMAVEGVQLKVGVYGAKGDGTIVIPTVWANFGKIQPSATPSNVDPQAPSQNANAYAVETAEQALAVAQSVRTDADNGVFNGADGAPGADGEGVPTGGTTGQWLKKVSSTDYDTAWDDLPTTHDLPSGGTSGQILAKASGTDYDVTWVDDSDSSDLYWCTYLTTTLSEIRTAVSDGLLPVVEVSNKVYVLGSCNATAAKFYSTHHGSGNKLYVRAVDSNDDWTSDTYDLGDYSLPVGGIPATDLASAVQASLGKADTALQSAPVSSVDGKTGAVTILPSGGASGYVLKKASATDYDVEWAAESGGGGGAVDSVNGQTGTVVLDADDVGAIAAPGSPSADDVLTYSNGAWAAAAPAHQLPVGGNAGEVLAKKSATDYDLRWRTINDWTPAGLCTTNGGTAAKVVNWSFWSATQYPSWLLVTMGNSNTYAGAITLKVNGSSVFPIYINGTASSATNYTLPAGSYLVYFDGTNMYFRTDGKIPGDITGHAGGDIAAPASPTTGDFLCWNGSAWAATSLSTWQGGNY